MRISRPTPETWKLERMDEFDVHVLRQIPGAADPEGCEAAAERLFPKPQRGVPPEDLEDWEDFLKPELEERFSGDLATVQEDLRGVTPEPQPEEEGDPGSETYALVVSTAHADAWYSALNQARLTLSARYNIPENRSALAESGLVNSAAWRAVILSDFYAVLQEWLIAAVLTEAWVPGASDNDGDDEEGDSAFGIDFDEEADDDGLDDLDGTGGGEGRKG